MKQSFIYSLLAALMLAIGSTASAANRFYADAINIEPGETKTLVFSLDNDQQFFGFQVDITLPEGLEICANASGKADISLSSRCDDSYTIVSNLLDNGGVRFGIFSTTHTAITGDSGALAYLKVKANSKFQGGAVQLTDVLFIDSQDRDVPLPDASATIGAKHDDNFYIDDFKIAAGQTKTVTLNLDNETVFSALQTDIYMPTGLTIVDGTFKLTGRASGGHSVSTRSFSNGRTRLACFAASNDTFSGFSGALLEFDVTASRDVSESVTIELKNKIFSTADANEYVLPNTSTAVTTEHALVSSISLNQSALTLRVENTVELSASVYPTYAFTQSVEWSSNAPEVATVSADGLVTAISEGSTVITCAAVDGSGVKATCDITVEPTPVAEITLNLTEVSLRVGASTELTASVLPLTATNKAIVWTSADEAVATVDDNGKVVAVALGATEIIATAADGSGVTARCAVSVVPTPTESVAINTPEKTELKVGESLTLTATVLPDDATNKAVVWTSLNPAIASIDQNGVITALALGEATIKATSADNSGIFATCSFTVVPTMVESIEIVAEASVMKTSHTMELSVEILPADATNKAVAWTTSDASIATVDDNGLVTTLVPGNVEITATAKDGSGVSAKFALTVIPVIKGDSNDNDEVTITDAVNTANYAVGNPTRTFCFEAADVNNDNRITLVDASATVTIVLEQEVPEHSAMARAAMASADRLIVDDFAIMPGQTASVFVTLDNSHGYVAMQADITVPLGVTLVDVKMGGRAMASHSLMTRRIDERTMRVALFDLNNAAFADTDDAILELIVKADNASDGNIEISRIIASDAQAQEYLLTAIGGNSGVTGIGSAAADIRIEAADGAINVYNAAGLGIAIYAPDGTALASFEAQSDIETRRMMPGLYIVAAGRKTVKVAVK